MPYDGGSYDDFGVDSLLLLEVLLLLLFLVLLLLFRLDELLNSPSPSTVRDLERLDLRLRAPSSSSNSLRDRALLLSRYLERLATANARNVAMNNKKENVRKALASSRAIGDSSVDFLTDSCTCW